MLEGYTTELNYNEINSSQNFIIDTNKQKTLFVIEKYQNIFLHLYNIFPMEIIYKIYKYIEHEPNIYTPYNIKMDYNYYTFFENKLNFEWNRKCKLQYKDIIIDHKCLVSKPENPQTIIIEKDDELLQKFNDLLIQRKEKSK